MHENDSTAEEDFAISIVMSDTVDVEYVGDPPLLDDFTKFRIQTGEISSQEAAILRGAQCQLAQAVPGMWKRVVDPEWFGTSKQYVFGPNSFVVAVDRVDVDKILGSASGHQFRVHGTESTPIIPPPMNLVKVSEVEGASLHDVGLVT